MSVQQQFNVQFMNKMLLRYKWKSEKKQKKCIRDYAECWMRQMQQGCSEGIVEKKYELNHLYFRGLDVDIISLLSCCSQFSVFFFLIFLIGFFAFILLLNLLIFSLQISTKFATVYYGTGQRDCYFLPILDQKKKQILFA